MPDDLSGWVQRVNALIKRLRQPPRWDAPMGGDPLRPLKGDLDDFKRTSACDCWDDASLNYPRKLRCRLFGCKHISDKTMRTSIHGWCEVHNIDFYNVDDGTPDGLDVHTGCCVRCGNPIIPRVRALKGSS